MKKCIICGKEFEAKFKALTCSPECSKERKKRYNHKFVRENKEYFAEQTSKWQKKHPDKVRAKAKRRYERDKEKLKVRSRTKHLINRLGLKTKGFCQDCEEEKQLEIHHITYTLDDFVLICRKCHLKRHNKILWRDKNV